MRIIDIITGRRPTLSFEVFPPKNDITYDSVMWATKEIASLMPDYMSVTYGAGGGTSGYTVSSAQNIKSYGVTPLAHLTCVNSTKAYVIEQLKMLSASGIENVMALRGDILDDGSQREYNYASELITDIRASGNFCIGGACYPQGHPQAESLDKDIDNIKIKIESGCDFLTSQMFFDNTVFYEYLSKLCAKNISVPVVAGIMPVTNAGSIKRICELSGTELPARFMRIVERYGDNAAAMQQAGIAYATEQVIDLLANGVNAVHIYSMNKPLVARKIKENLSEIMK